VWCEWWSREDIDDLNRLGELLSLYIQEVVQEPAVVKHIPIQNEMDVLKQELERTKLELAKTKEELQKTKKELEEVREAYLKSIVWLDTARARTRMESEMIQRGCYPGLPKKWEDMTSLLNELNGLRM
jgi:DNA gyrase/topoisomerase IV subunit A